MTTITINKARPEQLNAILDLLGQSNLPVAGVEACVNTAVLATHAQQAIAYAALEPYQQAALLRSVVVAPSHRGQGLGQKITQAAIEQARQLGIHDLYLLTETAVHFFPKFGFQPINRANIPDLVKTSVEFTTVCPDTAVAMHLQLP